jgi:hypothetical protein
MINFFGRSPTPYKALIFLDVPQFPDIWTPIQQTASVQHNFAVMQIQDAEPGLAVLR